jgi:glycerol-3-phosphate acyltransferase PlsY
LTLSLLLGYVLGAIPSSLIAGRLIKGRGFDLRQHGSGNAGATNAFRVLGPGAGVCVLCFDVLKGFAASAFAVTLAGGSVLSADPLALPIAAGSAAVLGHAYPVFCGFRGGKGVATAAGVMIAIYPTGLAHCSGVFAAVLILTGYVSAASICGSLSLPLFLMLWPPEIGRGSLALTGIAVLVPAFVILTHRANIRRLVSGTENRFEKIMLIRRLRRWIISGG